MDYESDIVINKVVLRMSKHTPEGEVKIIMENNTDPDSEDLNLLTMSIAIKGIPGVMDAARLVNSLGTALISVFHYWREWSRVYNGK